MVLLPYIGGQDKVQRDAIGLPPGQLVADLQPLACCAAMESTMRINASPACEETVTARLADILQTTLTYAPQHAIHDTAISCPTCHPVGSSSPFQSRFCSSNTLYRRLDMLSSGPKIASFAVLVEFRIYHGYNRQARSYPGALVLPGSTGMPYSRKSGRRRSFNSRPPFACGFYARRALPFSADSAPTPGSKRPFSSNSSSA